MAAPRRRPSSLAARKCAPAQIRLSAHSTEIAAKVGKRRVTGVRRSMAV
jgi:hypothetical protein